MRSTVAVGTTGAAVAGAWVAGAWVAGAWVTGAGVGVAAGAQAVKPNTNAMNSPTIIVIFLNIFSLLIMNFGQPSNGCFHQHLLRMILHLFDVSPPFSAYCSKGLPIYAT